MASPRIDTAHDFRRLLLGFATAAFLVLLLAGCSSGDDTAAGDGTLHLLIASGRGLTEVKGTELDDILSYDDGSFLLDPALSTDGKRIAYVRQPPAKANPNGSVDFGADLYVANRNGKNEREVVHHSVIAEFVREPAWLPDGRLLFSVYGRKASGEADLRIEVIDLKNGQRARVLNDSTSPAVAPDGANFVYTSIDLNTQAEFLAVSGLNGSGARRLVGTPEGLALIGSAVWSPDSSRIAFAAADLNTPAPDASSPFGLRYRHPTAQDVWLIDRDGRNLRKLTELLESQASIEWTPDGTALYILGTTGFWRIDVTSGEKVLLDIEVPVGQIEWLGR